MGITDNQSDEVGALADDVLLGAKNIAEHITALGFPVTEADVYYLRRAKKWPFNKYGAFLIASKTRLTRHAKELMHGRSEPDDAGVQQTTEGA